MYGMSMPMLASCIATLLLGSTLQFDRPTFNAYGMTMSWDPYANQRTWDEVNERAQYIKKLREKGVGEEKLATLSKAQLRASSEGKKVPVAPKRKGPSSTSFKPAPKRLVLQALVDGMSEDPEHRKALKTLFIAGISEFEKEAAREGMKNDLAPAMAFFAGSAYLLRDGVAPSDEGLLLLARGLQEHLDTPVMRSMSDAEKQRLYEVMVLMGTFLIAMHDSAPDSQEAEDLKKAAGDVLKSLLKLDPAKYRLTENGIERR